MPFFTSPVSSTTSTGARMARDHRTLMLAAAGAPVLVWLACRLRKG
ncbi:hypothetical protein [Streptomyces sp. NPDC050564]